MYDQRHEFAIYYNFSNDINIETNEFLKISDEHFYHRLVRVLRQTIDDKIIIFNNNFNILVKIIEITKKDILLQTMEINPNTTLEPKITVLISVLKKEAFEDAIYLSTELGASAIQPIISQKSYPRRLDSKEYDRLNKIIISAAEQSKNYKFPKLKEPISLEDFFKITNSQSSIKIFFDPKGTDLSILLTQLPKQYSDIYLMIGPEGDLITHEKEKLVSYGFFFCALTPTILRAQIAIAVSLGIFRSFFKSFNKKN